MCFCLGLPEPYLEDNCSRGHVTLQQGFSVLDSSYHKKNLAGCDFCDDDACFYY